MSSFLSNVLKLVSGSIVAQILGVILIPIVTRLYSPDDFGVYQLLLSITGILVIFSCLSYQLAIMLPKEDEDSASIVALCFILITLISIVSGSIFIVFSDWIGTMLNTPQISQYLIFLPFMVFLNGLFLAMTYWLSRRKRFGINATAQVVNSVSSRVVQIGFGLNYASPSGLIAGSIVSGIATLAVMFQQIKDDLPIFKRVTMKNIKNLAIRYKRFPIFTSWSNVANTISLSLPSFMLIYFFDPAVLGFYALANMVISMPMSMVGSATAQVFFQKVSEEKNRSESIKELVTEVHEKLIVIGIFPMIVLLIIAQDLFIFVFGPSWSTAGMYAMLLVPWLFLLFISSPLTSLISVFEKQNFDMIFQFALLLSRIVTLYIGGMSGNPVFAIFLFSITGAIFCGIINYVILKWSEVSIKDDVIRNAKNILLAVIVSLPLVLVKIFFPVQFILFATAAVVTIIYYSIVIFKDPQLKGYLGFFQKS